MFDRDDGQSAFPIVFQTWVKVVRRAFGWYVQLILKSEVNIPDPLLGGNPLGIDLGVEKFLATSTGLLIDRPKFFFALHSKLKSLQRKVSRKRVGSNNWKKACKKVARLHEQITNTRKIFTTP